MTDSPLDPVHPEDHGELVRRFDAGERTPALLNTLDRAAFDCFHAPWERAPRPRFHFGTPPVSVGAEDADDDFDFPDAEALPEDAAADLATLQFLLARIDRSGSRIFVDGMRSLRIDLGYDPVGDCYAIVALEVDPDRDLIRVRTWSDLRDERWDPVRAQGLCRHWNRRHPSLQAAVHAPDAGRKASGLRLRAYSVLPLAASLRDPAGFNAASGQLLQSVQAFWRFARRGLDRPPAA